MAVKPLTPAEKKWVNQLQDVLNLCPTKRLGAFTIGDPELAIYDKPVFDAYRKTMHHRDERDDVQIHDELGTVLVRLSMPFQVDGVSG